MTVYCPSLRSAPEQRKEDHHSSGWRLACCCHRRRFREERERKQTGKSIQDQTPSADRDRRLACGLPSPCSPFSGLHTPCSCATLDSAALLLTEFLPQPRFWCAFSHPSSPFSSSLLHLFSIASLSPSQRSSGATSGANLSQRQLPHLSFSHDYPRLFPH